MTDTSCQRLLGREIASIADQFDYTRKDAVISGGTISVDAVLVRANAESGSSDDLDNMLNSNGNMPDAGVIRYLAPAVGETITVRHGQGGAGQFALAGGTNKTLDGKDVLTCMHVGGAVWSQIAFSDNSSI